jgi:hypothetical protein
MATHQSKAQKETVERVMHEFKHGELKTSRGKKVKNPKRAIAIGRHEAGASKHESKEKNRRNLKAYQARERRVATEKDRNERGSEREPTRSQLYEEVKRRNIAGQSRISDRHTTEASLKSGKWAASADRASADRGAAVSMWRSVARCRRYD